MKTYSARQPTSGPECTLDTFYLKPQMDSLFSENSSGDSCLKKTVLFLVYLVSSRKDKKEHDDVMREEKTENKHKRATKAVRMKRNARRPCAGNSCAEKAALCPVHLPFAASLGLASECLPN